MVPFLAFARGREEKVEVTAVVAKKYWWGSPRRLGLPGGLGAWAHQSKAENLNATRSPPCCLAFLFYLSFVARYFLQREANPKRGRDALSCSPLPPRWSARSLTATRRDAVHTHAAIFDAMAAQQTLRVQLTPCILLPHLHAENATKRDSPVW